MAIGWGKYERNIDEDLVMPIEFSNIDQNMYV